MAGQYLNLCIVADACEYIHILKWLICCTVGVIYAKHVIVHLAWP